MWAMVRLCFGREAQHAADARLAFGHQQPAFVEAVRRRIRPERGEIVIENEGGCVARIACAAGALIAGAQVALRVEYSGCAAQRGIFHLALPGPLGAMRRYEYPFAR